MKSAVSSKSGSRKLKRGDSFGRRSARTRNRHPTPPVVRLKVERPLALGDIQTADDCLRATVKLVRRAVAGDLPITAATKLTFILNSVAQQIKNRDDTAELKALRQKLEELGALPPSDHLRTLPAPDSSEEPSP